MIPPPPRYTLFPYTTLFRSQKGSIPLTANTHRLGPGLPGYLILFAPPAFVPQCQLWSREPPSPRVFLPISTHFTATPGIPLSSPTLEHCSSWRGFWVKPRDFTSDLQHHLRTLY